MNRIRSMLEDVLFLNASGDGLRGIKQAMNLINTGDENSGPTQSMGEASVPAGISEHFTRAPDKSRTERLKELRRQGLTDLEYEIESSLEHWTEVETEAAFDEKELEAANRKVFDRLMKRWRCPKTRLCFSHDWGENLQVGRKLTEAGQAEIFEAEIEGFHGYVVKVFKKELVLSERSGTPMASRYVSAAAPCKLRVCMCKLKVISCKPVFFNLSELETINLESYEAVTRSAKTERDLKASNILVRDMNGDSDRFSCSYGDNMRHVVVDVADFESSSAIVGTGFWRAPEVLSALKDHFDAGFDAVD